MFLPLYIGMFFGVIGSIYFYVVYLCGANPFYSFPQKLTILFCAIVALITIFGFRRYQNDGLLSFGEGIIAGSFANLIFAIIVSIFTYIFCEYLEPIAVVKHIKTLTDYMAINKQNLINSSSPEMYQGSIENLKNVNSSSISWDSLIWKMIQGTMFSILISLVLRRKLE